METRSKRKLENTSVRELVEKEKTKKRKVVLRAKLTSNVESSLVQILTHTDIGPFFLSFLGANQFKTLPCVCRDLRNFFEEQKQDVHIKLFRIYYGFDPPPKYFSRLPLSLESYRDDLRLYMIQLSSFRQRFLSNPVGKTSLFGLEDIANNLLEETIENFIHIRELGQMNTNEIPVTEKRPLLHKRSFLQLKKYDKDVFLNYWKCAYDIVRMHLRDTGSILSNHMERFKKWLNRPLMLGHTACIDLKYHPLLTMGFLFAACYRTISSTPGSRVIFVCRNRKESIRLAKYASQICFMDHGMISPPMSADHLYFLGSGAYEFSSKLLTFSIHSKIR